MSKETLRKFYTEVAKRDEKNEKFEVWVRRVEKLLVDEISTREWAETTYNLKWIAITLAIMIVGFGYDGLAKMFLWHTDPGMGWMQLTVGFSGLIGFVFYLWRFLRK